jgi:hypothetical protein
VEGGLPRSALPYTRRARPEPAPPQTKSSCGRDAMSRSRGPPQGPSWTPRVFSRSRHAVARGLPLVSQSSSWHQAPRSLLGLTTHIQIRWNRVKHQPERIRQNITRSLNTRLTWAPRKLLISSPFIADTIRAPRVPLYGLDGHVSALGSPAGVAVAAEAGSSPPAGCGDALVPRDRQGGRKGFEAESRRSAGRRTAKQQLTGLFGRRPTSL